MWYKYAARYKNTVIAKKHRRQITAKNQLENFEALIVVIRGLFYTIYN